MWNCKHEEHPIFLDPLSDMTRGTDTKKSIFLSTQNSNYRIVFFCQLHLCGHFHFTSSRFSNNVHGGMKGGSVQMKEREQNRS